jgi:hypothetical protein
LSAENIRKKKVEEQPGFDLQFNGRIFNCDLTYLRKEDKDSKRQVAMIGEIGIVAKNSN